MNCHIKEHRWYKYPNNTFIIKVVKIYHVSETYCKMKINVHSENSSTPETPYYTWEVNLPVEKWDWWTWIPKVVLNR